MPRVKCLAAAFKAVSKDDHRILAFLTRPVLYLAAGLVVAMFSSATAETLPGRVSISGAGAVQDASMNPSHKVTVSDGDTVMHVSL